MFRKILTKSIAVMTSITQAQHLWGVDRMNKDASEEIQGEVVIQPPLAFYLILLEVEDIISSPTNTIGV